MYLEKPWSAECGIGIKIHNELSLCLFCATIYMCAYKVVRNVSVNDKKNHTRDSMLDFTLPTHNTADIRSSSCSGNYF